MTTLQKIQNLTWWNEISKLKDILTSLFNITENIDIRVINIENTPVTGNYIPLTGTTVGNPVTGNIKLIDESAQISWQEESPNGVITYGVDGGFNVISTDFTKGISITPSLGIRSNLDYSPNITDLDYPQKIYVDQRGSIINTTVSVLSASDLNTQYPNAKDGFQVICPNVIGGGKFYIKAGATWQYQAMLLVT